MATISEVLEEVGSSVELAQIALSEEQSEEKPRVTLVEALQKIIDDPQDEAIEDSDPQDEVESNPSASGVRRSHFIEVGTPFVRMN